MDGLLFDYEFFYFTTCRKAGEFSLNVRAPFSVKLRSRQLAGLLMLGFGVWYLGFGTQWIAKYRGGVGGDDTSRTTSSTKALITGVQVFFT